MTTTHPTTKSPILRTDIFSLYEVASNEQHVRGVVRQLPLKEQYLLASFPAGVSVELPNSMTVLAGSSLLCWAPGSVSSFGNQDSGWYASWLLCAGSLVGELLSQYHFPLDTLISLPQPAIFDEMLAAIMTEVSKHETPDAVTLHDIFLDHLGSLHRSAYPIQHPQRIADHVLDAKHFIDTHYVDQITLEQLAQLACMSIPYFCRQFRLAFACSPIEYHARVRMRHAMLLLHDPQLPIAEVARRVGYAQAGHFSTSFHKALRQSPRAYREQCRRVFAPSATKAAGNKRAMLQSVDDGWNMLADFDYTAAETPIDPRWQTTININGLSEQPSVKSKFLLIEKQALHLVPHHGETAICWEEATTEEMRIEVVALNNSPQGINLSISVSGTPNKGYRLRFFGYNYIALEKEGEGTWRILYHCHATLDAQATSYALSFWRSGNLFCADLNGHRMLTYYDPLAPRGPAYRKVGIGRFSIAGATDLRHIRIFARKFPEYVDILEVGRILLNQGHYDDARDWFVRIAREHHSAVMRHEADYLAVVATPETQTGERIAALEQIVAQPEHLYYTQSLSLLADCYLRQSAVHPALQTALKLAAASPDDDRLRAIAESALRCLRTAPLEEITTAVRLVAQLPLRALSIETLPLPSLTLLAGASCQSLDIQSSKLILLDGIASLPIRELDCSNNHIADLSPLKGLRLDTLYFHTNEVTDLSPLASMPLHELGCMGNQITDLTPLRHVPLVTLELANNHISDLAPLAQAPLRQLDCSANALRDLSSLANMPLEYLAIAGNEIDDLSPLRNLPLVSLDCENNRITDLSPLMSMPLSILLCAGNPLESLQPLRHLPLTTLSIGDYQVTREELAMLLDLPLYHLSIDPGNPCFVELINGHPTLQTVQQFPREHVAEMAKELHDTWRAWLQQRPAPSSLRNYAKSCGECSYLALPIKMSWQEAARFCQWQQGSLVSPSSEDEFSRLRAYLASVTYRNAISNYHLGISGDGKSNISWHSGRPCCWCLFSPEDECSLLQQGGVGYFKGLNFADDLHWQITTPDKEAYVIVEWRNTEG